MPFKSEKQRKWMHSNDPEMAKKWEKEKKMKQETKVRSLIRKMVREIMGEGKLTEAKKPVSFKLGGVTFGKDYQGRRSQNGGIRYYYQKGTGAKHMESDFGKFIVKVGGIVSRGNKNKVAKKLKEGKLKESDLPITTKKGKSITLTHKTSGKEIVVVNKANVLKRYLRLGFLPGFAKWNEGKIKEDFAGTYPKHVRQKFDNMRRRQSEVLGYKLTGKNDIKTEIDDATVKQVGHRLNKPVKESKLTRGRLKEIIKEVLNEAKEPLWTKDTVKDAVKQIKKGLKNAVPYLDDIGYSTLGGEHRISIIGKISLDKKNTWPNRILQNSRWALIHFFPDGTLDTIRMNGYHDYKTRKKVPILRKSRNKNLKQAIDRMGKYFTVVRTKYPDKGR